MGSDIRVTARDSQGDWLWNGKFSKPLDVRLSLAMENKRHETNVQPISVEFYHGRHQPQISSPTQLEDTALSPQNLGQHPERASWF